MITVTLHAYGLMRDYFPGPDQILEFADGATLGNLLDRIDQDSGERLADSIWNRRTRSFRGPVVIKVGNQLARDRMMPLQNRQMVSLFKAVVGG